MCVKLTGSTFQICHIVLYDLSNHPVKLLDITYCFISVSRSNFVIRIIEKHCVYFVLWQWRIFSKQGQTSCKFKCNFKKIAFFTNAIFLKLHLNLANHWPCITKRNTRNVFQWYGLRPCLEKIRHFHKTRFLKYTTSSIFVKCWFGICKKFDSVLHY